jgi:hypothetical protein
VRSGESLWTGLTRHDVVVAATLGPDDEVHYVVPPQDDPTAFELRTCHLAAHRCSTVARFPRIGVPPLLAR